MDKLATFSRFISRMSDRCQPFFQCIKKNVSVILGDEQKMAFNELKNYLSNPLISSTPIKDESFELKKNVSVIVVSVVLFKEE